MSTSELLAHLSNLGVKLWVEGSELGVSAPKGALNSELQSKIREHRAELIELLSKRAATSSAAGGSVVTRDEHADRREMLPLSFGQRRLWFLNQMESDTAVYNMPIAWMLRGPLNVSALERALSEIHRRHDVLHTRFARIQGAPSQVIDAGESLELEQVSEVQGKGAEERLDEVRRILAERAAVPFDLVAGKLLRPTLFRIDEETHVLLLLVHHIVFDGWSAKVFLGELEVLYTDFSAGREASLPELKLQYSDYAVWQNEHIESDEFRNDLERWKTAIGTNVPVLDIPTDRPRPAIQTFNGANTHLAVDPALMRSLETLAKKEGATLYMVLLAAYKVMLAQYSGQRDISVGTIVANRSKPELQELLGFFANTLVLRTCLDDAPSFRELLGRLRETCLDAFDHQDVPFEQIVEELRPERDLSRGPLFQTIFMTEDASGRTANVGNLELELFELETKVARTDLMLTAHTSNEGTSIWAEYNSDLFDRSTIERMLRHYVALLEVTVAAPDRNVFELELLPGEERERLLTEWNATDADYPVETIHRRFERQAEKTPDATALVFPDLDGGEDACVSYAELNESSNRLAHELQARGAVRGSVVGLCLERSAEMVVAQLAIQKTGAAYIPLDPTYPKDRLEYMATDAGLQLVVTTKELGNLLPRGLTRLEIDTDKIDIEARATSPLDVTVAASDRMYVIYTSGTTGRPKGVEIEHRAVSNFLSSMAREPGYREGERLLAVTTLSFDISVLETMLPLMVGGTVIIAPNDATANGQRLAELMDRMQPDVMQATPATWRMLLLSGWKSSPSLRIFCGGEALPRELAEDLLPRCSELWNLYGPTEATIWSTVRKIESGEHTCPIGRPIANTQVYVLGENLAPQPTGVPGELWIAGDGLARGYLGRDELTSKCFIDNPFAKRSGQMPGRMYRTGDSARWLPGGELECLGRIDNQVKLRGFRIELSEIEAVLAEYPGLHQCVCVLREDTPGDQRLIAYFVAQPGVTIDAVSLRNMARTMLPVYMVPSALTPLEEFPHTPNGKIDRRALQDLRGIESATASEYVAPRNELEHAIAIVWSDVLKMERVPVNENFFDLGGHSLLLAEAHAKLQERLDNGELSIVELFQYPTIESLAGHEARRRGQLRGSAQTEDRRKAASDKTGGRTISVEDIAIVGMAGRFPGARDIEEFWQNLRAGKETIRTFSSEELLAAGVDASLVSDPNYIRCWGYLEDIDLFDAGFFEMTPREAEAMDPQIRLLLETAWQALEKSGCDPTRPEGPIGVFAGASINLYLWENVLTNPSVVESLGDIQTLLGNDKDFISTTLSYKLDLKGPAITVQTACSTSLVATHAACQSLLFGESYLALAGGVSAPVREKHGYMYKEGGTFSEDGHVRAFDVAAKGMLGGYGVGMVALKLLRNAIADGDTIHAVIKGSALNNDGSDKVSFTAPSVDGQSKVVSAALDTAGVDPSTISYVECHGTGTPLGDPIEIKALTQAYRQFTAEQAYCPIGSVKTNIGHLDIAAGISGLIKTARALEAKEIPPSLNYETPNPELDLPSTPFFVNTELRAWDTERLPRRATVSSLGMGGTNAHVVLEEAPLAEETSASRQHQLLLFSARSKAALQTSMKLFGEHLEAHPEQSLADAAFTLQIGRRGFRERCFLVVENREQAFAALERPDKKRSGTGRVTRGGRPVVFLFSGQGAQYPNMALGLYQTEETFRNEVDRCCEMLEPHLGHDLRTMLFPAAGQEEAAAEALKLTSNTQPALFVIEHALAMLWMEWGVQPTGMLGHSIGEYVAAHHAGVFSLEDALQLVCARGTLIGALPAGGQMMAVHLPEDELMALLDKAGDGLSLAAVNAPGLCVVSGSTEALDRLQSALSYQEVPTRLLETSHAFHSAMLDPVLDEFRTVVAGVTLHAPTQRFVSCKTGEWITAEEATDPDYWVAHMREAVRFNDSVQTIVADGDPVLLEVGPGQTLTTLAQLCLDNAGTPVVPSTRHPKEKTDDQAVILHGLGQLWAAGADIDWKGLYRRERRRKIPLHTYPFERQRYYIEPADATPRVSAAPDYQAHAAYHPTQKTDDPAQWFYVPSWKRTGPPVPRRSAAATNDVEERWLLFLDESGVGAALADRVRASGAQVATVRGGDAFSRGEHDDFTIDPTTAGDYKSVLGALGFLPNRVVHLFGVDPFDPRNEEGREAAQDLGFNSMLFLGQALSAVSNADELRIAGVTTELQNISGDQPTCPEKATILGPCKALRFELEGASCQSIDLARGDSMDAERARGYAEQIFTEVRSASSDPILAFHGKHRWVLGYEPAVLDRVETVPYLTKGGTYLITGGLGGIGLTFAEYLTRSLGANLVLLGRSELPERDEWDAVIQNEEHPCREKVLTVRNLESLGAEVMTVAADVTELGQMEQVVSDARSRFGKIHGVLHCAGVLGSGLLEMKTREEAAQVMGPKLQGTQVLAELFREDPLELLVLFSSISSATGVLAGVDYCAANSYLDAVANQNASTQPASPTHVVAIDWDTWAQVGMAVKGEIPAHLRERHREALALGVAPEEGVEGLRRVLASGLSQVYVTGLDLTRRDDLAARQAAADEDRGGTEDSSEPEGETTGRTVYARPELSTEYVEPTTETEITVAGIWADLLGIEKVGIEDDFFELGGNSLVMMQLNVRLRSIYGVSLPIRQLFELPKVELLAEQIDTIHAAASIRQDDPTEDAADVEEFTI